MPLVFTSGDILTAPANIRVNTVNCVGVMGAGLALAFKSRYPAMFRDYQKACKAGQLQPGQLHIWRDPMTNEEIINFPTKRHWRHPSRYEDVVAGLVALRAYLEPQGKVSVALPALGAGHGGLEWDKVKLLIGTHLSDLDAQIQVFAPLDSREAGRLINDEAASAAVEQIAQQGIIRLAPDDQGFPAGLVGSGALPLYIKGTPGRIGQPLFGMFPSAQPGPDEASAASAYLKAVARPGITVLLGYGAAIERPLIRQSLASGAEVVVYVADTLADFRVRKDLQDVWDEHQITVISIARLNQHWNPDLASRTKRMAFALSQVALITEPIPEWISEMGTTGRSPRQVYHVAHQDSSSPVHTALMGLGATSLPADANFDTHMVTPLLDALLGQNGSHDLHTSSGEAKLATATEVNTEDRANAALDVELVEQQTFTGPEFEDIAPKVSSGKRKKRPR
ncbi:MAG: macro domain-containing protein [Chloroflexota bacterium]|nr:macro domain-containing protein [Chloroflexota bacterium]